MRGDERTSASVPGASENGRIFLELSERLLADGLPADERAHLLRLWRQLREAVGEEARRAVVARLLDHPDPPPDLLIAAAEDDPAIAAPLLKEAPFGSDELIALIARTGPAHHIEIARRADLTLDVWLALARAATTRQPPPAAGAAPSPAAGSTRSRRPAEFAQEEGGPSSSPSTPSAVPEREQAESRAHPFRSPPARPGGAAAGGPARAACRQPAHERELKASSLRPPPAGAREWLVLEDPAPDTWAFQTDRAGTIVALSPLAESAFGRPLSALAGRPLADLLAEAAPAPGPEWIAEALRERRVVRDAVVEILPHDGGPARRWRIRARPRFSFPEGRFLGYAGTARDLDRITRPAERPAIPELLDRMADAADRLARGTDDPRLEDYARTLGELARSLKAAVIDQAAGEPGRFPRDRRDS